MKDICLISKATNIKLPFIYAHISLEDVKKEIKNGNDLPKLIIVSSDSDVHIFEELIRSRDCFFESRQSYLRLWEGPHKTPLLIYMTETSLDDKKYDAFINSDSKKYNSIRIVPYNELREKDLSKNYLIKAQSRYEQAKYSFIYGDDEKYITVKKQINNYSKYDKNVLIRGESGTGKTQIARMIHYESKRKDNNFARINIGNLNLSEFEARLFGYSKGAFSGADNKQKGLLERTDGGTLFLDEIGNADQSIQNKILDLTQEDKYLTYYPAFSDKQKTANVRLIYATNKDLEKLVNEGKFLPDLYERIKYFDFSMPALKDTPNDIPKFIRYFQLKLVEEHGKDIKLDDKVTESLTRFPWEGSNIRGLSHVLEKAFMNADSEAESEDNIYILYKHLDKDFLINLKNGPNSNGGQPYSVPKPNEKEIKFNPKNPNFEHLKEAFVACNYKLSSVHTELKKYGYAIRSKSPVLDMMNMDKNNFNIEVTQCFLKGFIEHIEERHEQNGATEQDKSTLRNRVETYTSYITEHECYGDKLSPLLEDIKARLKKLKR